MAQPPDPRAPYVPCGCTCSRCGTPHVVACPRCAAPACGHCGGPAWHSYLAYLATLYRWRTGPRVRPRRLACGPGHPIRIHAR
jgi:hypothetical protein